MSNIEFRFIDLDENRHVLRNVRFCQFTRTVNKNGSLNMSLDITETSKNIIAGWKLEVWTLISWNN